MTADRLGHNGGPPTHALFIEEVPIKSLTFFKNRVRNHGAKQRFHMKRSFLEHGQVLPILIDGENRVIAGELQVAIAEELGFTSIQAIRNSDLSEPRARRLRLALNKIAEGASWNEEGLRLEFADLLEIDSNLDLTLSGFHTGEIDLILQSDAEQTGLTEDRLPAVEENEPTVSAPGDLWLLGSHRLYCGSALEEETYEQLLQGDPVDLVLTDPPYNVPIKGHVSGKGRKVHQEFSMASGEMAETEFREFLQSALGQSLCHCRKGALVYAFMDWRHLCQLEAVANDLGLHPVNLCIWVKTNPGMGSFYRSQHEMVYVGKKPGAPHTNNIELGRHGRNRSNVWTYPGANAFGEERDAMLAAHPTVKPVGLLADIIQDATMRDQLVLDPFAGSGSTLIAAEKMGRRSALVEIDPQYCDLILDRYQQFSGQVARRAKSGETFDERRKMVLVDVNGGSDG